MLMLSELLQFRVVEPGGGAGTLSDLVVGGLDKDYPVITHLIHRRNNQAEGALSWDKVKVIHQARREVILKESQAQEVESLRQAVWLRRDVLDALVIDLQNRRVTRANDLCLEEKNKHLQLAAADTGPQAILRRLTRGWYRGRSQRALYDWKYIEFLRGDPEAVDSGAGYHRRIVHLPPGEIAHLASSIPYLHAAELLELLPEQLAADTLGVMSLERQVQVFEELDEKRALHILGFMAPDVAADIIGRIDINLARHYLNHLPRKYGERIIDLLRYPENSVGGIMANDVVTVSPNLKIREARQVLREKLREPDFVYFLYVVEDQEPHKLRGVLSLRQLLMAEDNQTIEEIMNPYLITLSPFDSPHEAGYRLLSSQLVALPVVGSQGQLLGSVTIDAAVSQVAPRIWRAQAPRVFS